MIPREKPLLEISVDSPASAAAAERGGARRIELCANLLQGGVTPAAGMIGVVRAAVVLPLHVMIRPRGGDFSYTSEEFDVMKRDIAIAKQLGAEGVVLGVLQPGGLLDIAHTKELIELARPMSVTFHRAFDFVPDLSRALEDAILAGADRILTSGGAAKAEDALPMVAALVKQAGSRIGVVVCGGVREHNVKHILQASQAREFHVGQSGVATVVSAGVAPPIRNIRLGAQDESFPPCQIVSAEKVQTLLAAF